MILLLGTALLGCAKIESVTLPDGGSERGPVFVRDGQSVRHGVWTGTHPGGNRRFKVRYVRGVQTGLYQEWHPNGVLAEEKQLGWDGKPLPGTKVKRWNTDGTPVEPPSAEKAREYDHG